MKVQVTFTLESKKDQAKLNAIMAFLNGGTLGEVANALQEAKVTPKERRQAGRAFNDALAGNPSTDDMVEEMSDAEKHLLDLAMERTHRTGESPFADSLCFNRSEEIRQFVAENPGKYTVAQMGTIMHNSFPEVPRDKWIASGHAMCNPKQSSYSFSKKDGKLIPIHR